MNREFSDQAGNENNPLLHLQIDGVDLTLRTDRGLFSPSALDPGTRALLSTVTFQPSDKILDLGCGYGVVGILAAKRIGAENITMLDIDAKAVRIARENAKRNNVPEIHILQSDGFRRLDETGYTLILSNPPYHTDFSVAKHFIEKGFNRLAIGGRMVMVTKRKLWYQKKFTAVFGGVLVQEVDGYFVFTAERRRQHYARKP